MTTLSHAIVLRAELDPLAGVTNPGPHQRYRWPRLDVEQRPLGALRPGYVRVRMELVGVCGTDLHAARADLSTGYILGSAPLELGVEGRVIGHEGVGRIVEVGEGVTTLAPGAAVTFESLLSCLACETCRRGQFNHCAHARLVGGQVDGLFRDTVDLPVQLAHDVSDLVRTSDGLRAAACVEPVACSYVAVRRAAVRPGSRVVVFGAGPVGLYAAMLCQEAFGARVDLVEPVPLRRELAAAWCDRAYEPEEFFEAKSAEAFDVVIEASGDLTNVDRVLGRLAPCARVALLARCGQPLRLERVDYLITNGTTVFGSRGHLGGAFGDVLRLLRAGRLPLGEAVTGIARGLDGIREELQSPDPFERRHVKLLARLGDAGE